MTPDNEKLTIAHESGHAIAAWFSPTCIAVDKVDIHDNGSGGQTSAMWPDLHAAPVLWENTVYVLGGLAGEYCWRGKYRAAGADSDLKKALEIARIIIEDGMVERIPWGADGWSSFIPHLERAFPNGLTGAEAMVMNASLNRAVHLIRTHRRGFDTLCSHLAWKRHLTEKDLLPLLGDRTMLRMLAIFR